MDAHEMTTQELLDRFHKNDRSFGPTPMTWEQAVKLNKEIDEISAELLARGIKARRSGSRY